MPTRLIVIKHAQSQQIPHQPPREWPLTDKGRMQCIPLAHRLAPYHPRRIISSDEPKAIETGQLVAAELQLPAKIAADLHEHERTGTEYFDDVAQFNAVVRGVLQHPAELIYGNETGEATRSRFIEAVAGLITPDETTVIVSHGTVISLFVTQYNAIDIYDFWKALKFTDYVVLSVPNYTIEAIL